MNPKDLEGLVRFRSEMIDTLPKDDALGSELNLEDMATILDILLKTNQVLNAWQVPVTESSNMNATMYDPEDVAFNQDKPVAKTFSKLDILAGYTDDLRDDEVQAINQKISRDTLLPAYPPTPQNSSYGTDLRNAAVMQVQMQMQPQQTIEVSPWEPTQPQAYVPNLAALANIHQLPPEVQAWYLDVARYGDPEMIMRELGMIR